MKSFSSSTHCNMKLKSSRLRSNFMTNVAITIILSLGNIRHYSSQSILDEEISFDDTIIQNHHHFPPPSITLDESARSQYVEQQQPKYGWKSSLTSKCSKSCGKGFKILNLSCIDLKYNVRVGEDLCLKANLPRPRDVSDEVCNEEECSTESNPLYEPFFETGPWSECSGECWQLGKRTRTVSCRLYLSRSSRFAYLPATSCHHAKTPDNQEPCYMDCTRSNPKNDLDETVYDQEMARFVWIKNGYTKCSSECLGGQRESIIECWDKIAENQVDFSLCDLDTKPLPTIESCNDVPCTPEWRIEPFSSCSLPCGFNGIRTRSIACVQQIAIEGGSSFMVVQNEFCFQTNGTMPHKTEPCNRWPCEQESYIDADKNQEYHISHHNILTKKRTINLKIGGSAQVHEGLNLKIRCKIMGEKLVKVRGSPVEWRKDGVLIFSNGTTRADKQYVNEDIRNEILLDDSNQFMADQPDNKRSATKRNLVLRSPSNLIGFEPSSRMNFSFVPQVGGRFSLVKDNILRIKRLRQDDSGIYTCSHGTLSESLNLYVISRKDSGDLG